MTTSTPNEVLGWVDDRRRAFVNLRLHPDRTLCGLIDTGFNGYLLWEHLPPDLQDFGETSPLYEEVEVAGGLILVMLGITRVYWFGAEGTYRAIESLFAISSKRLWSGDAMVLIGTAMLSGKRLVIDFAESIVRIQLSS